MAIQMRRGNYVDFDPTKLVPGEWAISQDNSRIFMCTRQGTVVEVGSSGAIVPYVKDAEAWARGTRGGEPVDDTDPTYHNNSKYYSEQASDSASSAATSEINAATHESGAADKAKDSEAWAVGTKDGEPVPSTDPAYNNSAKHWAESAAAIVGIGIATTTTAGIVKPDGTTITVDPDGTIHSAGIEIQDKKVVIL